MYRTYRCMKCKTQWTEANGPQDCAHCGHKYIEVIGGMVENDNKKEEKRSEEKPSITRVVPTTRVFPSKRYERSNVISSYCGLENDCPWDPITGR